MQPTSHSQWHPLSPLIFVLTLEPFLQHIRWNLTFRGLQTSGYYHKVVASFLHQWPSHFNSDSFEGALYIWLPVQFWSELAKFGNPHCIPFCFCASFPKPGFPYCWVTQTIQYLGTKISLNLNLLLKLNYMPLLASLNVDLKKWKTLTFSWFVGVMF